MKLIKYPVLLILLAFCFSCDKEDNDENESEECETGSASDYLIFGHFYGECIGESCVEIFKLSSTNLSEDTNDTYPNDQGYYVANFVQLDAGAFEAATGLESYFPNGLWQETETVIGMPDAGDWGGLYIEYKLGNQHDFWLLDMMGSNVPEYLHPFITEVNERIALIND